MSTPLAEPKRWQEIATIWKDNRWLYIVAGLLLGVLVTPALEQITGDLNALIGNLVPEAVGIVFTVLILERLAENRQRENYKQDLIRQAGSVVNGVAVDAIEQLRKEGWLTGNHSVLKSVDLYQANLENARLIDANLKESHFVLANLQHADLENADLQEANLWEAKLQQANLVSSNLQQAILWEANLQGSDLENANLRAATLWVTNLQQANMEKANLQDANLRGVNLLQANLRGANLCGADLSNAKFDEKTVLPDAKFAIDAIGRYLINENKHFILTPKSYWTPETDMTRYTNPEHPDFWEPDWVKEQREQGKAE